MSDILKTGEGRTFMIEDGAGPSSTPEYQGFARVDSSSWPQGDINPIRVPSKKAYNDFEIVDTIVGQQGLPEMTVVFRSKRSASDALRVVRKGCPIDIQQHFGSCRQPTDFNGGWDFVRVLENARPSNFSTGALGALDSGEQATIDETLPLTGEDMYDIERIAGAELAASAIVQEVIAVAIVDAKSCGACGEPSDGTQRIFALTLSAGGSPGLAAEVIYSADQGATVGDTNITTLAANEDPDDMTGVGVYLVAVSGDSNSLHYAVAEDVLNGTETWQEVSTGFVAAKVPRAIFSLGATLTWIVGDGGYVYFTSDPTTEVEVQDAGAQTTENLADIHGVDEDNLVAVGANNAVLVTRNGGETWTAVTGPAVGVDLKCVWVRSANEFMVGDANGSLWFTRDGGSNWTEKTFPGSGSGRIDDIVFATRTVGYMAHATATPRGRVLRTIDGGHSWYPLPEETGLTLPLADRFNALAATKDDPNFVLAGGLGDNAVDGSLIKIA